MIDISNLGLGDKISNKRYGIGEVIKCTEKPSISVKFKERTFWISEDSAQEFEPA